MQMLNYLITTSSGAVQVSCIDFQNCGACAARVVQYTVSDMSGDHGMQVALSQSALVRSVLTAKPRGGM